MDVDAFLAELTPDQVDEWAAAFACGVVAEPWELAAVQAAAAHNAGVLLGNLWLAQGSRPMDMAPFNDFMPYEKQQKPKPKYLTPEEDEAQARMRSR